MSDETTTQAEQDAETISEMRELADTYIKAELPGSYVGTGQHNKLSARFTEASLRTIDAQAAEIEALTAQVEAMGIALGHQAVVIDALTQRDADQHAALKSIADITEKWLDAPDTVDNADANFNCLCSIADHIYPLREGLGFPPVKSIFPKGAE